eukprot:scaffold8864_cov122-Isochrysis_galbana.AAC.4
MSDPSRYPDIRTARLVYALQWLPRDFRDDKWLRQQWSTTTCPTSMAARSPFFKMKTTPFVGNISQPAHVCRLGVCPPPIGGHALREKTTTGQHHTAPPPCLGPATRHPRTSYLHSGPLQSTRPSHPPQPRIPDMIGDRSRAGGKRNGKGREARWRSLASGKQQGGGASCIPHPGHPAAVLSLSAPAREAPSLCDANTLTKPSRHRLSHVMLSPLAQSARWSAASLTSAIAIAASDPLLNPLLPLTLDSRAWARRPHQWGIATTAPPEPPHHNRRLGWRLHLFPTLFGWNALSSPPPAR